MPQGQELQEPRYRRLRAPEKSGGILVDPAQASLAKSITSNRQLLDSTRLSILGRDLGELAASARQHLLQAAAKYTAEYRDLPNRAAPILQKEFKQQGFLPSVVLAGHQPQLFHPGVWFKNFVLKRVAKENDALAVNLIIDSDLCRTTSIRVPTGTIAQPQVQPIAFDKPAREVPFEERQIEDDSTLESFPVRVMDYLGSLVSKPLVKQFWPEILERRQAEPNLGLCLAQARHRLEQQFWAESAESDSLELPQSTVCVIPEFHWFVAHLLMNLARFRDSYNSALADYRKVHRLRNQAHPVPNLSCQEDWIETPLWVWSEDDPQRRPLYARVGRGEVVLSDFSERTHHLPLAEDPLDTVTSLMELAGQGVKIRTRALCTTLFARLLLGDLFIHGIGGAKYDEVTDQIMRDFYGIVSPSYAIVTATLRLPIEYPVTTEQDMREVDAQLRQLTFHPEVFFGGGNSSRLSQVSDAESLISRKSELIKTVKTPENARERHKQIESMNRALGLRLSDERAKLITNRMKLSEELKAGKILGSREYSFCLFPAASLQSLLLDSAGESS